MAGNRTLTIIKPDAFHSGKAGSIIAHLEKAGFKIISSRVMQLSESQAQAFYAVHRERSFFAPLVRFMTSGKCMPMGSLNDSAPCAASCAIATAVNILFIEPRLNLVSTWFGTLYRLLASP